MATDLRPRYDLSIEELEPGYCVAWVLALPGCYAPGATRVAALDAAPARIAAYFDWLTTLGPDGLDLFPAREGYTTTIIEEHVPVTIGEDSIVNALFADDRRPLTADEIGRGLVLLGATRRDVIATVAKARDEHSDEVEPLLLHLARAEWWYFDRLGLAAELAVPREGTLAQVEVVRDFARKRLPALAGDGRVVSKRGELWSARKVLRRMLQHERDHTEQIARLARS